MATLATSKDLAEQMEFLTKHAAHKDDVAALSEHLDKKFAEHEVATVSLTQFGVVGGKSQSQAYAESCGLARVRAPASTYTVGEGTGRLPHRCCT